MEKQEVVTLDRPVNFKRRENRKRPRRTYTLSNQTLERLEALVSAGEVPNLSRAIDLCAEFYESNASSFHVRIDEPKARTAFIQLCLANGSLPGDVLASLAKRWAVES